MRYTKSLVGKIVRANGGMAVGKGPGTLYDQKKFDIPYIRDFLLDRGIPADVSETSTPWSKVKEVHDETVQRAQEAFDAAGHRGFIMCHLSHSYHSGACQYFTFAIADASETNLRSYDTVKRAIQQSFMNHGGTVSHHHGVGEEHSPWMEQDISPAGVRHPGETVRRGRPRTPPQSRQDRARGPSGHLRRTATTPDPPHAGGPVHGVGRRLARGRHPTGPAVGAFRRTETTRHRRRQDPGRSATSPGSGPSVLRAVAVKRTWPFVRTYG